VESPDSSRVEEGTTVMLVPDGARRLARVRALSRGEGETQLALLQRARTRTAVPLALGVLLMLVASWRRPARTVQRIVVAAVLLVAIAIAPLSALSNVSPLFDASSYFAAMGGPWTANVAALLFTTALGLTLLFLTLRSGRVTRLTSSRALALILVLISASLGPFILRDLARGIALPSNGVSIAMWIAWQLAIALAGASILHAGAAAGRTILGDRRGLPRMTAPLLAILAAVLAPVLWRAPGTWPGWYPVLWGLSIGALAFTRRGVALVTGAAVIAGAGAVTLTWGATVRARMALAQYDLIRLSAVDDNAFRLLDRLASSIAAEPRSVTTSEALLRRYAASELAQAGYPARLARWDSTAPGVPTIDLRLAPVSDSIGAQVGIAAMARASGVVEIRKVEDGPTTMLIAAIPAFDGSVTSIAVPPRTRLLPTDPFASLTGIASRPATEPPYRLSLGAATAPDSSTRALQWRRRGDVMHGDGVAAGARESRLVHVEVDLRGLDALLPRGALLVLLDVAVVLVLWGASAMADGAFGRWLRVRRVRVRRSYRVRLSATLLAFFLAPAALFAGNAWYRLQDDDRAARELLVREALRTAATDVTRRDLAATANSVGSPIFLYHAARLDASSDTLLQALAPLGRLLPVSLDDADFGADDVFTTRRIPVGETQALVGFRRVANGLDNAVVVTPARGDEFALDARREDLGMLLLFTAALGALAAVWSSGIAARALSRPVGELREAALTIAAGRETQGLGRAPASEFAPVYRAFGRMAEDLSTSRAALEAAQRRTAAVLQHVASGVVAMRADGEILIANPRAEQLLGVAMRQEHASIADLPSALTFLTEQCVAFLAGDADDEAFDQLVSGRQLRGRLTRLPSGAVLTVDDVTELASAQRVLAWGEMARQVAHEIKNPLTPIRLGVQHLRRAFRDGRGDFSAILDANVTRILAEIDHLDEIARAFSRYGMMPDQRAPATPVDVLAVVRDVLALEQLGVSDVEWILDAPPDGAGIRALGQADELKEVLLNLLENARLAQARLVHVSVRVVADGVAVDVRDNGQGIAADVLPQVFEPHFSTRTSGSGLGLAISRRLLEGWGGRIALESTVGVGTVVHVMLRTA
jgi:signal transduction histidine kinase